MRADDARIAATIYYDGDCRLCAGTARRLERVLTRRRLAVMPLQTTGAAALLGVSEEQLLDEVRLRLDDGSVLGGANAVVEIARRIWWAWPFWAMSRIPGVMPPLHRLYRWVARNRYCLSGSCRHHVGTSLETRAQAGLKPRLYDALPLVLLPILSWFVRSLVSPWIGAV